MDPLKVRMVSLLAISVPSFFPLLYSKKLISLQFLAKKKRCLNEEASIQFMCKLVVLILLCAFTANNHDAEDGPDEEDSVATKNREDDGCNKTAFADNRFVLEAEDRRDKGRNHEDNAEDAECNEDSGDDLSNLFRSALSSGLDGSISDHLTDEVSISANEEEYDRGDK